MIYTKYIMPPKSKPFCAKKQQKVPYNNNFFDPVANGSSKAHVQTGDLNHDGFLGGGAQSDESLV